MGAIGRGSMTIALRIVSPRLPSMYTNPVEITPCGFLFFIAIFVPNTCWQQEPQSNRRISSLDRTGVATYEISAELRVWLWIYIP